MIFAQLPMNAVTGQVASLDRLRDLSGTQRQFYGLALAKFLRESDENPFRHADVAEAIGVLILHYVTYELRTTLAESFKRLVDVIHREHDAEVA